jgi:hypothetical protein
MDNINTRTAEILINGFWESINPIEIKNGMTFRMFEGSGELITNKKGQSVWTAISDAYYNDKGIICVET